MSEPIELNQSLDEQARQAYLSAMQVEQWVPLAELSNLEASPVIDKVNQIKGLEMPDTSSTTELNESSEAQPIEAIASRNQASQNRSGDTSSGDTSSGDTSSGESEVTSSGITLSEPNLPQELAVEDRPNSTAASGKVRQVEQKQNLNSAKDTPNKHFLKLVNWSNRVLSEQNAKSLMIVCRHQVDQPANSFARSNSPSQFMMDYINALNHYCANHSIETSIQLAHLSAAGLSDESIPLEKAIQKNKPNALLLLGDETVSHLLGESMAVASCRGQVHKLADGTNVLVSYHPYSLIKNPSLKRLAFEDLALASAYLTGVD